MDTPEASPFAAALAAELRAARSDLAMRWLDRIAARASIDPNRVFPTDELLDHMPLVIGGIAWALPWVRRRYWSYPASTNADVEVNAAAVELVLASWAEFPEAGGAIFAFSLPCRRAADLATSKKPADANKPDSRSSLRRHWYPGKSM